MIRNMLLGYFMLRVTHINRATKKILLRQRLIVLMKHYIANVQMKKAIL